MNVFFAKYLVVKNRFKGNSQFLDVVSIFIYDIYIEKSKIEKELEISKILKGMTYFYF